MLDNLYGLSGNDKNGVVVPKLEVNNNTLPIGVFVTFYIDTKSKCKSILKFCLGSNFFGMWQSQERY